MGFTTKCFIRKNTQDLRDELERLGYDLCQCTRFADAVWLDSYASGTIHGDWFTLCIQSFWQGGILDVDGNIFRQWEEWWPDKYLENIIEE